MIQTTDKTAAATSRNPKGNPGRSGGGNRSGHRAAGHDSRRDKDQAEKLLRRLETMRQARRPFEPLWDEVARYMGPQFGGFDGQDPAMQSSPAEVVETASVRKAVHIFSAGLLSGLSSPSSRWFALACEDADMDRDPQIRAWLQEVEESYYRDLASSDFYSQQHLAYQQAGLFGWQAMYLDDSPAGGLRFNARPLKEIFIAEDFQGAVDTVFRVFSLTPRQAAQKWGRENLTPALKRALDSKSESHEEFSFLHAVLPRSEAPGLVPGGAGLPYASFYVEMKSGQVMARGGYFEMPFVVARSYRLPGTPYSYSPGTEALADVKMQNAMKRLILEAGQLAVAPPYLVPDDGFVGRFSFAPRAMNYYRKAEGNQASDFSPLNVGGDPGFTWELFQAARQDVREAFFCDLFLAVTSRAGAGAAPTALEIAELARERMFLLGPMLIRQQHENFDALFSRLYAIKRRRGEIPAPPPGLERAGFRPEYVSPLAMAQRDLAARTVLQGYADAEAVARADPRVLDVIDHDQALRRILDRRGFPAEAVRTPGAVAALRQGGAGRVPGLPGLEEESLS